MFYRLTTAMLLLIILSRKLMSYRIISILQQGFKLEQLSPTSYARCKNDRREEINFVEISF